MIDRELAELFKDIELSTQVEILERVLSQRNEVLEEAIEAVESMLPCKNHMISLATNAIEKLKQPTKCCICDSPDLWNGTKFCYDCANEHYT